MTARLKVYVLACPDDHSGDKNSMCKGVLGMMDSNTGNKFLPMFNTEEEAFKASLVIPNAVIKEALVIVQ